MPRMDKLIVATVDRVPVNVRCMLDEKSGLMKAGGWVSSTCDVYGQANGTHQRHRQ